MRTVVAAVSITAAAVLLAGCQQAAEPPAKAAGRTEPEGEAITARAVTPRPAVGALFLGATDTHTCTGSVVRSASKNLVLTAAHCLADGYPATFVPGFADKADPANIWTVDAVYLDPRWVATQDPMADYAFLRVSRPSGGSIETAAGAALDLGATPTEFSQVTIVGYPLGVGGDPISCDTIASVDTGGFQTLQCGGLVDGTSGAPWIKGPEVVGVIGGRDAGGCQDSVSFSAPFDAATAALLKRAEAGGPGDAAPNTFASEC
ncbi:trypsin-like peptidase domain-containing protein [Mycobacterium sp. M26]|uniref:trypsin-like serine peptidase n=1 Tax=Mycobacterium sp. M26 TaxID=1762962 RepID=UPI00073F8F03|nr:trypsin-like peptidase domain-containing protein [Mycobacterium sp. M26]